MSDAEKKAQIKKTNGVFQLNVKPASGDVKTWTIDLKKDGEVVKGPKGKPGALAGGLSPAWGTGGDWAWRD